MTKKNICNKAMSHAYRGQYTIAMREVRKALNIDTNYGLAYLTRGIIYETAAEKCVQNAEGKISFDDKLVYELAYKEYEKAKRDLAWKSDAERRMNYLQNLVPTREDRFMHKNKTMPEGDCYSWIR